MNCYHCGSTLDLGRDICTKCGKDIRMFKKIVYGSNRYYNEGLLRAEARDLSGARDQLRLSLKLYRENIPARNLLGLVEYAMGESAEALKQWVISKNIQPDKNIADRYINMIRRNMQDLDSEGHGLKKFNQALQYANSGAKDLAEIQLKKVISVHPNMTKAYELLALLYIDEEQYDRARKILEKCLKVDKGNPNALRYLKELNDMNAGDASHSAGVVGDEDREKLIIPVHFRDFGSYLANALYILLGVAIGIAVSWFVIVPGRVNQVAGDLKAAEGKYQEQIAELQQRINVLENGTEAPTEEPTEIPTDPSESEPASSSEEQPDDRQAWEYVPEIEQITGWMKNNDAMPQVATLNGTGDYSAAIHLFFSINPAELCDEYRETYLIFCNLFPNPTNREVYAQAARDTRDEGRMEEAAEYFNNLTFLLSEQPEMWLQAALAYEAIGDKDNAINRFYMTANLFPDTEEGAQAREHFAALTDNAELRGLPEGVDPAFITRVKTGEVLEEKYYNAINALENQEQGNPGEN